MKKFKSPQQTIVAIDDAAKKLTNAQKLIHHMTATLITCYREVPPPTAADKGDGGN